MAKKKNRGNNNQRQQRQKFASNAAKAGNTQNETSEKLAEEVKPGSQAITELSTYILANQQKKDNYQSI